MEYLCMPKISAFADEISPDPKAQMDGLDAIDVKYIELRGAYGENVMKFSPQRRGELKKMFDDRGFRISAIGSPIGKAKINEDRGKLLDDFKHAVELAGYFDARFIRIFSFYPPDGEDIADHRGEVVDMLARHLDLVAGLPITLALENESNLFGSLPERCAYLHAALPSPQLVAAMDPGNFVNMNVKDVYRTCWLPLRKNVGYLHIKDFQYGETEAAVPAGKGDGCFPQILRDAAADGYDGFFALEPHLVKAEHSTGHTGPEMFKVAADALRNLCSVVGWSL
jgi:sugar phosphate isomerase/epimerase